MPRRLKLSPLQRDIMVTLAEAGGGNHRDGNGNSQAIESNRVRSRSRWVDQAWLYSKETSTSYESKTELVLTTTGMEALRK